MLLLLLIFISLFWPGKQKVLEGLRKCKARGNLLCTVCCNTTYYFINFVISNFMSNLLIFAYFLNLIRSVLRSGKPIVVYKMAYNSVLMSVIFSRFVITLCNTCGTWWIKVLRFNMLLCKCSDKQPGSTAEHFWTVWVVEVDQQCNPMLFFPLWN